MCVPRGRLEAKTTRGSSSILATGTVSHSRLSSATGTILSPVTRTSRLVNSSRLSVRACTRRLGVRSPEPTTPHGSRTDHSSCSAVWRRTFPASTSSSRTLPMKRRWRGALPCKARRPVPVGGPLDAEQSEKDPGFDKDKENNSFLYRDADPDGDVVPRAAHIRKANPRDQQPPGDDDVRHRRMLRRGDPVRPGIQERPRGRCLRRQCSTAACASSATSARSPISSSTSKRTWMNTDSHPHDSDGIDPLSTRVRGREPLLRRTGR